MKPETAERKERKRQIARDFQRKLREGQAALGRKAVTLHIDPEIYERIEAVKSKEGFPNLREATYHVLKQGLISHGLLSVDGSS